MKKVLIEIPDDYLTKLNSIAVTSIYAEHIIKSGEVISDMTNGKVIKALFPNFTFIQEKDKTPDSQFLHIYGLNKMPYMRFDLGWWNAPYKKE